MSLVCDQQTIEINACKPFRSEDVVKYCTTANGYNAGRTAEVLDDFGVWVSGIIKIRSMNLLKYLFAAVPQCMPLVVLLTWCKFMSEPHLNVWWGIITRFVCDDVVT